MNADARREIIQEFVDQNHDVSFARIRDLFPNVSEMTIRRDLEHLSQSHKIIRVLGGARSVGSLLTTSEDAYTKRSLTHADGKKLIAQKARELVQPDSTIFLGSGTTTCLNCAIELSSREDVSILMLGGSINKNSYCVNGSIAAEMVENMRFNIAFLGVSGYFPGKGFATSVAEDYVLRQKIVERSDCTVILMDSSKASSRGIYTFAPLDAVSYVVSDGHLPQEMVDEVTASGVTVL